MSRSLLSFAIIFLVPLGLRALPAGELVYANSCATCHGADGTGWHEKNGPTLIGIDWVTGDAKRLVEITLHGLEKRIPLGNGTHYGVMPPHKDLLDDAETASVLTYIRQAWGNKATAISAAEVATIRGATKSQTKLVTAEDLGLEAKGKVGASGEALMPPGKFAQEGMKTYLMICVGCHQINGRGLKTDTGHGFPPLVNSDLVNGPQNTLIRVILGGLEGKNNAMGGPANETMPPWGAGMTDSQVAQVLTFLRQSWGHAQGAISPAAVTRLREETKTRNGKLWNPADLKKAALRDVQPLQSQLAEP